MAFSFRRKMAIVTTSAVFFIVIDRFLKMLAFKLGMQSFTLLGNILSFRFAENYYIAFSLPLSGKILNTAIILISLLLTGLLVHQYKKNVLGNVAALIFILFGAISNFVDRMMYGFVVDYLDLKYFTVFNLADAMIVGGTILLLLNIKKNSRSCS